MYNLAAMSLRADTVGTARADREFTAVGVTRMLDAIRIVNPAARGSTRRPAARCSARCAERRRPRRHRSIRSPYGVAKVYGHFITVNYRESYGIFACSGILFNHECPKRGLSLSRARSARRGPLKLGPAEELRWEICKLGVIGATRATFVRAMWMMMQQETPKDYVVATGTSHSARDLVDVAFAHAGLDPAKHVRFDPSLLRPADVDHLIGDASRARADLGREPEVSFERLVQMMVDADIERLSRETDRLAAWREFEPSRSSNQLSPSVLRRESFSSRRWRMKAQGVIVREPMGAAARGH